VEKRNFVIVNVNRLVIRIRHDLNLTYTGVTEIN